MRVVVTGSSGLIGTELVAALRNRGDDVVRLVRRTAAAPDEAEWNPGTGHIEPSALVGVAAVVNLAGAGVGDHRWTGAYKREIRTSRTAATHSIAAAISALPTPPQVLVSASAIGFYGDTGERVVDESSPVGVGFLAEVVEAWEVAAEPARAAGIRVVHPRSGLVVSGKGGAWQRMFPLFKLGAGGKLGSGNQYWSFIAMADEIAALLRLIDDDSLFGPINLTAPQPVTNAEVTRAMGEVLHRPTMLPVPAFALRAVLGEFSSEVLGSARVIPARLTEAGFQWLHADIRSAIAAAL
jgi:uncharacterized protein (TIGR01777 family)